MNNDVIGLLLMVLGIGIGYNLRVLAMGRLKEKKSPGEPPRRP